jgi:hypothetical protein
MSIVEDAGTRAVEGIAGLTTQLIDGLDELGAVVATPREPARRGRSSPSGRPTSRHSSTRSPRASSARARPNLRIALHLYNVDEDIDAI